MNSHAGEVGARQQVGLAQHHRHHRRHRGEPGGAVALDRLDIGARRELRQQHDGGVRGAGELGQRQRVHVIERRGDQIAVAGRARARAAPPPPRCGSGARARRPWACRSSPRCRGTSPARLGAGTIASNGPSSRNASKLSAPSAPNTTAGRSPGQSLRRCAIAEHQLGAGILDDEMDGLLRKLEVHRHRDEAGAHDAEIGGDDIRRGWRRGWRRGRRGRSRAWSARARRRSPWRRARDS